MNVSALLGVAIDHPVAGPLSGSPADFFALRSPSLLESIGLEVLHNGVGRKNPDNIDVIEHRRLEACPGCSGEFSDLGVGHHHTVEDIVLTVKTTQYQLHRHHCDACQRSHLAPLPANLGGAVRIGLKALAAWMRFDMRQSIGNIARFFTEGIGLSWSKGSISRRLSKLIM